LLRSNLDESVFQLRLESKPFSVARAELRAERLPSALFTVGNTPLLKLDRISRSLLGKAEYLNPTGSVKDRAAANMLRQAIENGSLKGKEILDSSSGNTGISLAAFGAAAGYKVTVVLPSSASIERQKLLKIYGARIVFSDPMEGSDGAIIVAKKLAVEDPQRYLYVDQYSNDANWQAHYFGTAEEIWRQTDGRVTHFVSGVGTGGTVMGTGKKLRELNPKVKIIAVQPSGPFHGLEGLKHIESSIKPKIFDTGFPDETVYIETEKAQKMVKHLARDQGVFVGTSSGATVLASLNYTAGENCVVAILADQGTRYLSEKYIEEVN
jgi:S-sulfo-L-cysteine synthase (O-acetyl-L-serine-dependent)